MNKLSSVFPKELSQNSIRSRVPLDILRSKRFLKEVSAGLRRALAKALPMGTAVDGELVAFDESGRPKTRLSSLS